MGSTYNPRIACLRVYEGRSGVYSFDVRIAREKYVVSLAVALQFPLRFEDVSIWLFEFVWEYTSRFPRVPEARTRYDTTHVLLAWVRARGEDHNCVCWGGRDGVCVFALWRIIQIRCASLLFESMPLACCSMLLRGVSHPFFVQGVPHDGTTNMMRACVLAHGGKGTFCSLVLEGRPFCAIFAYVVRGNNTSSER